jgi:hypothetical protein
MAVLLGFIYADVPTRVREYGHGQLDSCLCELNDIEEPSNVNLLRWVMRFIRVMFYRWSPGLAVSLAISGVIFWLIAFVLRNIYSGNPINLPVYQIVIPPDTPHYDPLIRYVISIAPEPTVYESMQWMYWRAFTVSGLWIIFLVYIDYFWVETNRDV